MRERVPQGAMVQFSVLVRVIEITSGRIVDSGGASTYPDLASVGPVITDFRAAGRVGPQPLRQVAAAHSPTPRGRERAGDACAPSAA